MELAGLIDTYRDALQTQYADRLLPSHHAALDAISRCRTPAAGEILARCTGCGQTEWHPRSCGHRSCPKCQNHETTQWLERQREVQSQHLPVSAGRRGLGVDRALAVFENRGRP